MPDNIQSMIVSRVDALSESVRTIVKTASVLGRKFSVKVLSSMLKNKSIKGELNNREYSTLIAPINEINYIFRHAIIRESLYQLQMKEKIGNMHILAGECMESLYKRKIESKAGELAYHFENGGDSAKAEKYLLLAGEYAVKKYMNLNALDYYSRSLNYSKEIAVIINTHEIQGNIYKHLWKWDEALKEYFSLTEQALLEWLYDNYTGMNTKESALYGRLVKKVV
ncbi:MAG: hypothetical protein AB7T10_02750 [bacterium]